MNKRASSGRGGNGDDYNHRISEILGKLPKIVPILKQGFEPFTYKKAKEGGVSKDPVSSHTPEDDDVWYEIIQYLVAAADAFRYIENPDVAKVGIKGAYNDIVGKIFESLIKSEYPGRKNADEHVFGFDQLPFYYNPTNPNLSIKHLVPGFHLLHYADTNYPRFIDSEEFNPFIGIILYLYHYISLLETTNLNVDELFILLQADELNFMSYLGKAVETFQDPDIFAGTLGFPPASEKIIENGLIQGLKAVAKQIINKMDKIKKLEKSFPKVNINDALGAYKTIEDKSFNKLLLKEFGNDAEALVDPTELKKYQVNSLLNPYYITNARVKATIDTNIDKWETIQIGGVRQRGISEIGTDGQTPSLPYLYGPEIKGRPGIRNISTTKAQGDKTDANFVDAEDVIYMTKAVDVFSNMDLRDLRKIGILSLYYYVITNDIKGISEFRDAFPRIQEFMDNSFQEYRTLFARLEKIPLAGEKIAEEFMEFKDEFVKEFVRETQKYLKVVDNKLVPIVGPVLPSKPLTRPTPQKKDLSVPDIKQFYKDVILKNEGFFKNYFNLIDTNNQPVDLATAKDMADDNQLKNYRLNVLTLGGKSLLGGRQRGGANGDIMLVDDIPALRQPAIWIDKRDRIPRNELGGNGNGVKNLVQSAFLRDASSATIKVGNVTMDVPAAVEASRYAALGVNIADVFNEARKKALQSLPGFTAEWKCNESALEEHMFREAANQKWFRKDGNGWVRRDKDGNELPEPTQEDHCKLIANSTTDCINFLKNCALADYDGKEFPVACEQLFSFNFNVNPPLDQLATTVSSMDPSLAFRILQKFGFGYFLTEEKTLPPVPGFRRYKVESVGTWIKELLEETNTCPRPGYTESHTCPSLKKYLGEKVTNIILDKIKEASCNPLFSYLDVLVHWVNANPQALNIEETVPIRLPGDYPKIDKSFNMYNYLNPYTKVELKMRNLSCGLERLKSSIMNEITGAKGPGMMASITGVPIGIEMPLARPGFTYPSLPMSNYFPGISMYGGGLWDTDYQLQNLNQQYGHQLFSDIYNALIRTMGNFKGNPKINLADKSRDRIEQKLSSFKTAETDLRKEIINFMEQNKLYQASRGYVDPFKIEKEGDLKAVMQKHSNLLNQSRTYNQRAMNMIDLFQTIANAILEKISGVKPQSASDLQAPSIHRPLNPGYPLSFFKKT